MTLRVVRRVLAFVLVFVLSGCLGVQPPAPVTHYGRSSGAGSTGIHTVSDGENLYLISSRYRLPIRDIVMLNDIHEPFVLVPGQRLRLPPPREYRVQTGDSLYEISRLFGTNTNEIVQMNDLPAPYHLHSGDVLRLPSPVDTNPLYPASSSPSWEKEGSLGQRWRSFLALGQTGTDDRSASSPQPPPEKPALASKSTESILGVSLADLFSRKPAPSSADTPTPIKVSARSEPPDEQSSLLHTAHYPRGALSSPPPRTSSGTFAWPVRGRLLSGYGPKKGGLHNDGINIAAARGTPVKAAENGVVVYAGSGLEGYGNLVLIRHQDRWVTAYGHMDKVNVRKGDVLRRGQTIGTAGSTGSVDSPQLHFEIRRGTKALDPKPLLG